MIEFFKDFKPGTQFIFFLFTCVVSTILISFLGSAIAIPFFGMEALQDMNNNVPLMRYMQGVSQMGMFLVPALVFAYLFYGNPIAYFSFQAKGCNKYLACLFLILFLVSIPVVEGLSVLNQSFVYPEWMKGFELFMKELSEKNELLITQMLDDKSIPALAANIFIIGILPAFAEELFFRGVLQQLLIKWAKKTHLSVIIIAIVFSAIHLDFLNFLPRVFLGLILGYAFLYTKTIWVPILIHLINNISSVLLYYFVSDTSVVGNNYVLIALSVVAF
ncbi:CPBP family intramembrane metalloprotease, partial [Bacteroidales bacterium OttesenSCG-928-C19]|nr:CPBP family intramembrane metalloprotease [Bacteroidales bacterium OttesenSCG-928-C19]